MMQLLWRPVAKGVLFAGTWPAPSVLLRRAACVATASFPTEKTSVSRGKKFFPLFFICKFHASSALRRFL
jgi:hypothetical protein